MSKSLFINNKRVVIDEQNTYFPFQYRVNDVENIDVIGVPVSKTIEIPRCQNNDEIFGYLGDIHRTTQGFTDGKSSVSFNQLKKGYYKLFNESEIISEGIITISDIDDNKYSINLIDELIDKMERLNTLKLHNLHYYNSSNIYSDKFKADCYVVGQQSDPFIPTINIKEYDYSGTKLRRTLISSTGSSIVVDDLQESCNGLQTTSTKNYDVNYALNYKNLVKGINQYNFNTPEDITYLNNNYISYDDKVGQLLEETYLLCNKPTFNEVNSEIEFNLGSINEVGGPWTERLKKSDNSDVIVKNGKYELNYKVNGHISSNTENINIRYTTISSYLGNNYTQINSLPGAVIGEIYVGASLALYNSSNVLVARSDQSIAATQLKVGINVNPVWTNGTTIRMDVSDLKLKFTFDVMPLVNETDGYYWKIEIDTSKIYTNDSGSVLFPNAVNNITDSRPALNLNFTNDIISYINLQTSVRTGDWVYSSLFMPKVTVKDTLLAIAKYFNLNIENKNGSIYLSIKKYHKLSKKLIIDDSKTSLKNGLIDFDKIILSANKPDAKVLDTYEKQTGEKYAQKLINTGYTIKENKKEITYDVSIPILDYDINNYAYSNFMSYNNNGYNRYRIGNVTGFDDKINFCYLNIIPSKMFITNDTRDESGMIIDGVKYDRSFINNNEKLTIDNRVTPSKTGFILNNSYSSQSYYLSSFYTTSPYTFNKDGIITKSLELNKPKYNFVSITDSNYNENTTVYNRFFKKQLTDTYNVDIHLIKTEIFIDGKPDVKAIYNINNSNYIITNLPEYDPTTPNMYEVELLKVNDTGNYINMLGSVVPKVKIDTINNISTTFSVVSTITDDGNNEIIEKGIVYSSSNINPTELDTKVINNIEGLTFTSVTSTLSQNTDYYVRSYIKTTLFGTTYSDTIKKYSIGYGVTALNSIVSILNTTAIANCSIIATGGSTITERGVVYSSSNTNPTIGSGTKVTGATTDVFNVNLSSLTQNTLYYIKSFVTNALGTSYSVVTQFTTKGVPSLSIVNIDLKYATRTEVDSAILSANGGTITDYGICYRDGDYNPTIANTVLRPAKIIDNLYTIYNIVFPFPGLRSFAAFATNEYGTGYSTKVNFTVAAGLPPTVRWNGYPVCPNPTIYPFDIRCSATIYDQGAYAISEIGFLLKDGIVASSAINILNYTKKFTHLPTTDMTFTDTIEEFATAMASDYTIVAYAKAGTGGAAVYAYTPTYYYKSPMVSPPSLYLDTVTLTSEKTIIASIAEVVSVGSALVQKGILVTTDVNKTLTYDNADYIYYSSSPNGSTFVVSALLPSYDTEYYVRAFARNVAGITYSNDTKYVRTDPPTPKPSIPLYGLSGYTLGTEYTLNFIKNVPTVGIVWSKTNSNPTISDNLIVQGSYTTPGTTKTFNTSFTATDGMTYFRTVAYGDGIITGYCPTQYFEIIP